MSVELIELATFAIYSIVYGLLRLDSRMPTAAGLLLLLCTMVALMLDHEGLTGILVTYAFYFLASAAVILAIEYFRGEPERRSERRHEQAQKDPDHKS